MRLLPALLLAACASGDGKLDGVWVSPERLLVVDRMDSAEAGTRRAYALYDATLADPVLLQQGRLYVHDETLVMDVTSQPADVCDAHIAYEVPYTLDGDDLFLQRDYVRAEAWPARGGSFGDLLRPVHRTPMADGGLVQARSSNADKWLEVLAPPTVVSQSRRWEVDADPFAAWTFDNHIVVSQLNERNVPSASGYAAPDVDWLDCNRLDPDPLLRSTALWDRPDCAAQTTHVQGLIALCNDDELVFLDPATGDTRGPVGQAYTALEGTTASPDTVVLSTFAGTDMLRQVIGPTGEVVFAYRGDGFPITDAAVLDTGDVILVATSTTGFPDGATSGTRWLMAYTPEGEQRYNAPLPDRLIYAVEPVPNGFVLMTSDPSTPAENTLTAYDACGTVIEQVPNGDALDLARDAEGLISALPPTPTGLSAWWRLVEPDIGACTPPAPPDRPQVTVTIDGEGTVIVGDQVCTDDCTVTGEPGSTLTVRLDPFPWNQSVDVSGDCTTLPCTLTLTPDALTVDVAFSATFGERFGVASVPPIVGGLGGAITVNGGLVEVLTDGTSTVALPSVAPGHLAATPTAVWWLDSSGHAHRTVAGVDTDLGLLGGSTGFTALIDGDDDIVLLRGSAAFASDGTPLGTFSTTPDPRAATPTDTGVAALFTDHIERLEPGLPTETIDLPVHPFSWFPGEQRLFWTGGMLAYTSPVGLTDTVDGLVVISLDATGAVADEVLLPGADGWIRHTDVGWVGEGWPGDNPPAFGNGDVSVRWWDHTGALTQVRTIGSPIDDIIAGVAAAPDGTAFVVTPISEATYGVVTLFPPAD